MTRAAINRHSFNSGEFSPLLHWRSDLDRYHTACKRLENFLVTSEGAAVRRSGTKYMSEPGGGIISLGFEQRLIPFRFDIDTYYVIMLSNDNNDTRVYVFDDTGANIVTTPDPLVLDSRIPDNTLRQLQFAQVGDVLFLSHEDVKPQEIQRVDGTWTIRDTEFNGGPYQDENVEPESELAIYAEVFHSQRDYAVGDYVIEDTVKRPNIQGTTSYVGSSLVSATNVTRTDNGTTYYALQIRSLAGATTFSVTAGIQVGDIVQLYDSGVIDSFFRVNFIESNGVNEDLYLDTNVTSLGAGPTLSSLSLSACKALDTAETIYKCITAVTGPGTPPPSANWEAVTTYQGKLFVYAKDNTEIFYPDRIGAKFQIRNEESGSFSGSARDNSGTIQMREEFATSGYVNGDISRESPAHGVVTFKVEGNNGTALWTGKVVLQASDDNGEHWYTLATIQNEGSASRQEVKRNVEKTGTIVRVFIEDIQTVSSGGGVVDFHVTMDDVVNCHSVIEEELLVTGQVAQLQLQTPVRELADTYRWSVGSFNDRDGYPRCVTIHEERLFYAATAFEPTRLWGSLINDFSEWQQTTLDTSPVQFSIAADTYSEILWLVSREDLVLGTAEGEWSVGSRTQTEAISGANIFAKRGSEHGSHPIQAILADDRVMFVERYGKKLRGLIYDYDRQGYQAEELTALSRHIVGDGQIVELALQKQPDNIIWCLRDDGDLAALTFESSQEVAGWSRHTIAGNVKSICVTPGENGSDQLWILADRSEHEYLETLSSSGSIFLDCHVVETDPTRVASITQPDGLQDVVLIGQDVELTSPDEYILAGDT